jgi:RecB family exonuclease
VRIAAAGEYLERLGTKRPFLVVASSRYAADRVVHDTLQARGAAGALFGAFRFGLFVLAERLAQPEFTARGLRALTPAARLAAVVRVIHQARHQGRLGRFREAAEGPGLAVRLAATFDELRLADMTAERVAGVEESLGTLYGAYVEALGEIGLADRAATFAAAARRVENGAGPPVGLPLLLLDAPLSDVAARRFAIALAAAAPEVLLTVPEGDPGTEAVAQTLGAELLVETGDRMNEGAADDAVVSAQRHLFATRRPDPASERRGLSVIAAPGTAAEAIEHSRAFLAEAAEGVPFDRMAVLLPEPASQASAFQEAFERAGIPAFFEAGARRPHPAGRAFLVLLDCAREGLSATRFAEYLSLGETPAPSTGDAAAGPANDAAEAPGFVAPRRWERLILDSEVIGGLDRWERRLHRFDERLRQDEEAEEDGARREHLGRRRADLRRLSETALPILRRLAALPAPHARYFEWVRHLEGLAREALLHPQGVIDCLAETDPMRDVSEVTLDEVRESLSRRLAEVVTRSRGGRYGRVWVGPIEAARGLAFDVVALPGLSERAFPRALREDPMLLDRQREALSPDLPVRADLVERERLRLRIGVGAATRKLILSYSSLNLVEGRPQVPSYYLAEVFRAGLGKIPALAEIRSRAGRESKVVRGIRAPLDPSFAIDRREFDLAQVARALGRTEAQEGTAGSAAYVLSDRGLGRALRQEYMRQQQKWQSPDGFLHPDQPALEALERHRPGNRSFSATGLEAFATCPYQFFLKNLVRLRPVERPEALIHLDPLTRGSLLHDVFFHLGRELRERGLTPLGADRLDEAFALLTAIFWRVESEVRERVAPAIERIWRDQMDGLLGDLRGFLQRYAATGRIPLANELTFGMGAKAPADPESRTEAAVLPGGLRLHGAIDVVERLPDGDVQITDYKTGRASIETTDDQRILFGGRALQPLLYALAYEALSGSPTSSGRLYYATIRGAYLETVVDARAEESRAVFESFVAGLDRAISGGRFPALPHPGLPYRVCEYCDYLPVCGPRPATYARTKRPAGFAAALDDVVGIRSLP